MQNSLFPVYVFLSLMMGALLAVYLPMNAAISRYLGSPVTANLLFFFVAFVSTSVIFLFWGDWSTLGNVRAVPGWLFLSGVVSAFMILGTTLLLPKIGARQFFILLVSGQVLMSIVVSHYGFLGLPKDAVSLKKVIGASLVIVGLIFSTL